MIRRPPRSTPLSLHDALPISHFPPAHSKAITLCPSPHTPGRAAKLSRTVDRKSTRLNSSHVRISYAVFCLKKNKIRDNSAEDFLIVAKAEHARILDHVRGRGI